MTKEKIYCNQCGKQLKMKNGYFHEGVCSVHQQWGYFSEKDGENHSFHLCEACYDKLVEQFLIPVEVEMETEIMGTDV
ncbi:MAG: hypothetical protein PHC41_04775 [Lachnospiraceae bacterium]|nr:hypothetical protein [Lachnospiraceae bacterium]MDD3615521.1 hypothetical protein [Lachnospiraceae bacterium]